MVAAGSGCCGLSNRVGAALELYAFSSTLMTYSRWLTIACSRSVSIQFLSLGGTSRINSDSATRTSSGKECSA